MIQHKNEEVDRKSKTRMLSFSAALCLMVAAVPVAYGAVPGEGNKKNKNVAVTAKSPGLKPEAERHLTKAEHYEQQAETHQQEIKRIWKEYRAESKKIAVLPKSAVENPYLRKLRLQTEERVKELEAKAEQAADMARYHRARAREAQDEQLFSRLPK